MQNSMSIQVKNKAACSMRAHFQRQFKTVKSKRMIPGLFVVVALLVSHPASAGITLEPVNLGSTAGFAILAGAAITTTGGGIINGDVGASPISGSAIGIPAAQVNGTIYTVDASGPAGSVMDPDLLNTAMGDLTIAFNDAAGRSPTPTGPFLDPGAGNMGGLTLVPGLYKFTSSAFITGSDLTLAGGPDDVWIFQIASELIVGSAIHVVLSGGARARNIFWQVGTSATIGTFAVFKGTILADQAITMNTSSTMDGRALAFEAGVTYNGDSGGLDTAAGPKFMNIIKTSHNLVNVILSTTPNMLVTLQSCPDLILANWTTIATTTPITSLWSFTNRVPLAAHNRFYRAFISTE